MTRISNRRRRLSALALGWLVVAVWAAALDWPTPRRLSEERLQRAYLVANTMDRDFRPYDQPPTNDPDARYRELVADFRARFGERFDLSVVTRRHDAALAGMSRERRDIVAFTIGSTAVLWWLLCTIGRLLDGNSLERKTNARGETL